MDFQTFLRRQPVLTWGELRRHFQPKHALNARTLESLVAYHVRCGHLVRVRRGLFLVVPPGASPDTSPADPYLLAARMTDDATLAYHTALEVHGKAHSIFERFYYLPRTRAKPTTFRGFHFESVRPPTALRDRNKEEFGVKTLERSGMSVRATTLERTLVDVLDRPHLGGGWEEVWRSLESVEFFDLAKVVEYALLLNNATTAAKVGYFLDQHRQSLMVTDKHLHPLKQRRPKQPHYLERGRGRGGRLASEWNLVVPQSIVDRSWEEPS